MTKFYLSVFIAAFLFSFDSPAINISGTVTDQSGTPVSGAMVKFSDPRDPSQSFSAYTGSDGRYTVDETTSARIIPAGPASLYCYPNPFNRQTVISFHLGRKQRVEVSIYNAAGQKIRVVANGDFDEGRHQTVWDGLSSGGTPVTPGLYICSLQTKTGKSAFKMIVTGGENIAAPVWSSGEEPSVSKSLKATQLYTAYVSGNGFTTHQVDGIDLSGTTTKDFVINRAAWTPFSTTGNYLGVYNGKDYTPVFIKGVNIGATVPGSQPGQLAVSADQYKRWFQLIAGAGFNTIRIYTLHFPRFYDEFARYNRENPDKPLYLLHGAWLNEEYSTPNAQDDQYSLTGIFDQNIQEMIDCMHGNKTISPRIAAGYGQYKTDVSPWVIGFVIGREIHAAEVSWTNYVHRAVTGYSGAHVAINPASPTEAWSAERVDKLMAYERTHYQTARPAAFSSWLTLDPITHPSEDPGSEEDSESINLNEMKLVDAPGGYFVSYHAYPYYPNFINWDEKYQNVYDDDGINNYLACLRDLRSHYTGFPLLITEFGVPSSYGNARFSLSGMNHGGMTEEQQGNYNMRMLHNIYDTDCGGGVMFSWMDEWFKRTWITNPVTSDRRYMWHNICSPENNFGLIRFDPNPNAQDFIRWKKTTDITSSKVSKATMWHDFTFINLETALKTPLDKGDTLWVAFDTYKPAVGESTLPNGQKLIRNRAEFLLRITPDSANLYIIKAYNLLGLVFKLCEAASFRTQTTDGAPWQLFQWQNGTNWHEGFPYMQDIGKLSVCFGSAAPASHQAVQIRNDGILIRIPWGLLHFSDPSSAMVIDDNVSQELCKTRWNCGMQYLQSSKTDGINVSLIYKKEVAELATYRWDNWELNAEEMLKPEMFIEVEKASLSIIREGLKNNPFTPK
jgi:hypothetical protein